MENTKIGAYATSHLNSDNEGEPRKNISFVFFVYFFQLLIIEREGLYLSSFCNVSNISGTLWEWLESIKVPADESYRDGLTKKAAHLWVENTKIGAYAISHLKSDNEGEPGKIGPSFSLFISFNYWLLKGKVCTSQVSVMFQYHWYIVRMVRKHQIPADES